MTIRLLTVDEHQRILAQLVTLGQSVEGFPPNAAGFEYTSLLACFHLHNLACVRSLLALAKAFGNEWFPVTPGYAIARSLFETEINAHYIAADPATRSKRYLDFVHVVNKREMEACAKHRKSSDPTWREAMETTWQQEWANRERTVNAQFARVAPMFRQGSKKTKLCSSWAGKSIREMAVAVNHEEAYDVFYGYLSSFAHSNIRLADRFLRATSDGPIWSMRAEEGHVGRVFQHAAIFFTCFLELIASEFGAWAREEPSRCWSIVGV